MKSLHTLDWELTWWDEYDSKECVEVVLVSKNENGTGELYLSIAGVVLSLEAWNVIARNVELKIFPIPREGRAD